MCLRRCQKLWDLLFASQDLSRSGGRPCIIKNNKCIILELHNKSIRLCTVARPDSGDSIVPCTYLRTFILIWRCRKLTNRIRDTRKRALFALWHRSCHNVRLPHQSLSVLFYIQLRTISVVVNLARPCLKDHVREGLPSQFQSTHYRYSSPIIPRLPKTRCRL